MDGWYPVRLAPRDRLPTARERLEQERMTGSVEQKEEMKRT